MKIKYFMPAVLTVEAEYPGDATDHEIGAEIDKKIRLRLEDFLIYWQQQDGVEVTARFTKQK